MDNPSEEICMESINQNPWSLELINNQTENMCVVAVKLNENVFEFVDEKFKESCSEYVKKLYVDNNDETCSTGSICSTDDSIDCDDEIYADESDESYNKDLLDDGKIEFERHGYEINVKKVKKKTGIKSGMWMIKMTGSDVKLKSGVKTLYCDPGIDNVKSIVDKFICNQQ